MRSVTVALGKRSYSITIAANLFDDPSAFLPLQANERALLVTNDVVGPLFVTKVRANLEQRGVRVDLIILPDGECYKSLDTLNEIFSILLAKNHGRDTTLVALGGGVIGDLTGFAAATYLRGVRYIQVPTTLLSQVDSAVGGKTAVNHELGKNMIGAFYQPASVVIDLNCLHTLPLREFISGLAEVIKYGIALDYHFFTWLELNLDALLNRDVNVLAYCISRCCELKATAIATDEHEKGTRTLLNLGHTYGHAIEVEMGYGHWLHGEAIAAGIAMAARTAHRLGVLNRMDLKRICQLLSRLGLPIKGPTTMVPGSYLPHMLRDKKVLGEKLRLVLPVAIGQSILRFVDHEVVLATIEDC